MKVQLEKALKNNYLEFKMLLTIHCTNTAND